jgi:predicted nucleic-acid-binding protein
MMVGLDTSVLVRYIAQDDPRWTKPATDFIEDGLSEQSPGYVNVIVLVELAWTLRSAYNFTRENIASAIEELLQSSSLRIAEEKCVQRALLKSNSTGAGFADCLIAELNTAAGAAPTYAIDKRALRGDIFKQVPRLAP